MSDIAVPAADQPWRVAVAVLMFVSLFSWVVFRLHHLQVEQGEDLADMGERQRMRTMDIQAPRGRILDASGTPLALSDGRWAIYVDPGYMDDKLRATVELSRVLGIPRDELKRQFEARFNGRRIAQGLDDQQADAVRDLRLAGLHLRREFIRVHPEGSLAPHVLGFVLADGRGGAGIEQECNRVLLGTPGKETYSIDALGHPVLVERESTPAAAGAQVQLTIDVVVQRELEAALAAAVTKHQPLSAMGLVIRPATGEVVALASWPTFDVGDFSQLKPEQLRNNAISFVYEPGSTMKPLVAGACVADGLAQWQERIWCERGRWTNRVGRGVRTISDHSVKHGGHEFLTVVEGIALSDNILMAKLGLRLGPDRLCDWITNFRFGGRTGISLPGEDAGIVQPRAKWNPLGACMSIPMGHEIAVTPIQMAMAHAMVANGGMWRSPRLIQRIWTSTADGRDIDLPLPHIAEPRRMLSPEDAGQIQEAMTHTMTEGTGKGVKLNGYTSAGKTGTTEKLVGGRYSTSNHIGSFVCWAPASAGHKPELLALVVIDDPKQGGHYGSETAAPVVQRVLQAALERAHVPFDAPLELEADPRGLALNDTGKKQTR